MGRTSRSPESSEPASGETPGAGLTGKAGLEVPRQRFGGGAHKHRPRTGRHQSGRRRRRLHLVVFLGPALLVYTVFMVYPLLDSLRLSLYDSAGSFAGLDNFRTLLGDAVYSDRFWNALKNNFIFFLFHFFVQNPVGLLLAALLTAQGVRGQNIYRTVIFLPTTLSVVIVGFVWRQILSPLWGINESALLGEPSTVLPTLSLISVWQYVGIPMIFFYAVLISIPRDLIEAARVDGASG
ncbi:MAG: sugar ABC transporter permease, partial [bacterium]|nr:sugar ABC transporter permease [bacterium]